MNENENPQDIDLPKNQSDSKRKSGKIFKRKSKAKELEDQEEVENVSENQTIKSKDKRRKSETVIIEQDAMEVKKNQPYPRKSLESRKSITLGKSTAEQSSRPGSDSFSESNDDLNERSLELPVSKTHSRRKSEMFEKCSGEQSARKSLSRTIEMTNNDPDSDSSLEVSNEKTADNTRKTLERRGPKKTFQPSETLLDRAKERNLRAENKELDHLEYLKKEAAKRAIIPKTPTDGSRKSRRIRFRPGQKRFFQPMLTDKAIKEGKINFMKPHDLGDFVPPIIQPDRSANVQVLRAGTNRERREIAKTGKKTKVNLDDSIELFQHIPEFDYDRIDPSKVSREITVKGADKVSANIEIFDSQALKVYVDLESGRPINMKDGIGHAQVALKVWTNNDRVTMGHILFSKGAVKDTQKTGENEIYFNVVYGGFKVIINGSTKYVKAAEFFWVPPGNEYSLKNVTKKNSEIQFTLVKNVPKINFDNLLATPNDTTFEIDSSLYQRDQTEKNDELENEDEAEKTDLESDTIVDSEGEDMV